MDACKPILTPVKERLKLVKDGSGDLVNATNFRRLIRSLSYLTVIRPNIVYRVGIMSIFMDSPLQSHWQAAKRILRYIKNSDWVGDVEKRKSTSSYVFHLCSGAIS
ncbi:hypothetical protein K2173_013008 [Erythroxylum novogranatense]|uniref:Retrovirus-related Pol polyprotein from transposon TNT 1-94 n=1 Tax=Erythroxylum novogranatense TaxID=1862640 RepID=A0AAV8TTJ4_9ROSI|nr:hypothetical protein K2173_013008 [Erythroxylum novogranatense]